VVTGCHPAESSAQLTTWSDRSARASSVRMPTSRLSATYACQRVLSAVASKTFACFSVKLLDGLPLRPRGGFTRARDVTPDKIIGLGMPDDPLQRVTGDLERTSRIAGHELAKRQTDIARGQDSQRPGADDLEHRPQQALVEGARPLGRAVQPLAQPVVHGIPHRVSAGGPDSRVQFLMQRLELLPDFLLRSAEDFPSDPLPVWPVTKRDRSDIPVLRRSEVDRVLAATAAADFRLGHGGSLTLRLPATPFDEALGL